MGHVFVFSITAAFNPTLLAATTVMLCLERPKRLLLGYLCGAMLTSITLGIVIVFAMGTPSTSTTKNTINPIVELVIGALILLLVFIVATGRDKRRRARSARRKAAKEGKPPPKWQQALSGGTARTTFVIGALLTLPGGSYLAGLHGIDQENLSTPLTVLSIIGFNIIMLALLEIPLLGYTFAPERTEVAVKKFSEGLSENGGKIALIVATVVGAAFFVKGLAGLIN